MYSALRTALLNACSGQPSHKVLSHELEPIAQSKCSVCCLWNGMRLNLQFYNDLGGKKRMYGSYGTDHSYLVIVPTHP